MDSVAGQTSPAGFDELLETEIEKAADEQRPISRNQLAHLLMKSGNLHLKEAEQVVDDYCDEKAPGVPTYLSGEFLVGYLKMSAFFNVGFAMLLFYLGTKHYKTGVPYWICMGVGSVFLVLSIMGWVKSLKQEFG